MTLGEGEDQLVLLTAALEGLQLQKQRLERQIEAIEKALRGVRKGPKLEIVESELDDYRSSRLSDEGRAKISTAQKRRWEAYRRANTNRELVSVP